MKKLIMLSKKFFFYSVFSILALFSSEDYTLTTKIKEYWKNTKEGITNFQDKRPVVFACLVSVIAGLGMYGSSAFALGKFFLPLDTKASSFKKALRSPFLYGTAAFSLAALYFLLKKDPDRTSFSEPEQKKSPAPNPGNITNPPDVSTSRVVSDFVEQGTTYNEENKREESPAPKTDKISLSKQEEPPAPNPGNITNPPDVSTSTVVSNFVKHGTTCEEKDKLNSMKILVFSKLDKPKELFQKHAKKFNFPAKKIELWRASTSKTYADVIKNYYTNSCIIYMFIDIDSENRKAIDEFNKIMRNGCTFDELCTFAENYDNNPMNQRTTKSLMYLLPLAHTDNPEDTPIKPFDNDKKFSFSQEVVLEKHRIATKIDINSDFKFEEEMSKKDGMAVDFSVHELSK